MQTDPIHHHIAPVSNAASVCPPCPWDCRQGDDCPDCLQSTSDYGHRDLLNVILALVLFWTLASAGLIYVAVTS